MKDAAAKGDERRLHVRLARLWEEHASKGELPSVDLFSIETFNDSMDQAFMIDVRDGVEEATIQFVGKNIDIDLAAKLDGAKIIDAPFNSTFSQIAEHFIEAVGLRTAIGYEGDHGAKDGERRLYRGIIMPLSSDGETVDFVAGAFGWKKED